MGGPERLEKLAGTGKLDARARLDVLLDEGSFVEIGLLARSQHPSLHDRTPADGLVAGHGTIGGRTVYVTSEDVTVVGGTRGARRKRRRHGSASSRSSTASRSSR